VLSERGWEHVGVAAAETGGGVLETRLGGIRDAGERERQRDAGEREREREKEREKARERKRER
jgi:hypothetical protein